MIIILVYSIENTNWSIKNLENIYMIKYLYIYIYKQIL